MELKVEKLQKYGFIVHKINSLQTLAVARSMGLTDDGLMLNKNDETRIKSLTPWIAIGEVSQCSLKKGDKIEIFKLKRINVIPFVSVFDTILGVVQDVELIDGLYGQEPALKSELMTISQQHFMFLKVVGYHLHCQQNMYLKTNGLGTMTFCLGKVRV